MNENHNPKLVMKDETTQEMRDTLGEEIVSKYEEFNVLALQFVQAVRQLGYKSVAVMANFPTDDPKQTVLSSSHSGDPHTEAQLVLAFLNGHPEIKVHFMLLEVMHAMNPGR